MTETIELLRTIPAFARLTETQLRTLALSIGTQSFARGEPIFHQGSSGSVLYIITAGRVRIFTIGESGQEITISFLRAGDFLGEISLLDGQPRTASAVATSATRTLTLHRAAFLQTLETYPAIAASLLEVMATRLRQSNLHLERLSGLPAPTRVVRKLIDLATSYGMTDAASSRIDLYLTQDDLASLSGTTRETVNRVLSNLRDQGLIRVERARVSLLDIQQLVKVEG
jgi:CRP-like cAMP-binding protein